MRVRTYARESCAASPLFRLPRSDTLFRLHSFASSGRASGWQSNLALAHTRHHQSKKLTTQHLGLDTKPLGLGLPSGVYVRRLCVYMWH